MDFGQGSGAVKLTMTLESQDVRTIRPDLEQGCWGGAQQYCTFWQSQHLHMHADGQLQGSPTW